MSYIETLSLHDALPIFAVGQWLAGAVWRVSGFDPVAFGVVALLLLLIGLQACYWPARRAARIDPLLAIRSEEHTSELQSQSNLVCRLLLEKKNKTFPHV